MLRLVRGWGHVKAGQGVGSHGEGWSGGGVT